MNKRLSISFFIFTVSILSAHAQWTDNDSINLKRILSREGEIKLNPEAIDQIRLEIPILKTPDLLKPLMSTEKPFLEFKEDLPYFFTDSIEGKKIYLTLKPYNIHTKWNEDPIYGGKVDEYILPMATKEYSNRPLAPYEKTYGTVYSLPSTGGSLMNSGGNGGAGAIVSFSMEDVVQKLFSKKGRARMRNAKNANAWKKY